MWLRCCSTGTRAGRSRWRRRAWGRTPRRSASTRPRRGRRGWCRGGRRRGGGGGLVRGGRPVGRAEWAELVAGWFPELVDARARSVTWPEIDGHRELIGEMVKTNTVTTVHQRLRDEHGLRAGITSVRRYVASE